MISAQDHRASCRGNSWIYIGLPLQKTEKLIYYEHCTNVLDAIAREKQIKNWSRDKKAKLIATLNPRWIDLAPEILGE